MSLANLIMFGLGLVALAIGLALLLRAGDGEVGIYVRRITGTMAAALGVVLMIFAIGLARGLPA